MSEEQVLVKVGDSYTSINRSKAERLGYVVTSQTGGSRNTLIAEKPKSPDPAPKQVAPTPAPTPKPKTESKPSSSSSVAPKEVVGGWLEEGGELVFKTFNESQFKNRGLVKTGVRPIGSGKLYPVYEKPTPIEQLDVKKGAVQESRTIKGTDQETKMSWTTQFASETEQQEARSQLKSIEKMIKEVESAPDGASFTKGDPNKYYSKGIVLNELRTAKSELTDWIHNPIASREDAISLSIERRAINQVKSSKVKSPVTRDMVLKAIESPSSGSSPEPTDFGQGTRTNIPITGDMTKALQASEAFMLDNPVVDSMTYKGVELTRGAGNRYESQREFLSRALTYGQVKDAVDVVSGAPKNAVITDSVGKALDRDVLMTDLNKELDRLSQPSSKVDFKAGKGDYSYAGAVYYGARDAGFNHFAGTVGAGFTNFFEGGAKVISNVLPSSYEFVDPIKGASWGKPTSHQEIEKTFNVRLKDDLVRWKPESVREGVEGQGIGFEIGYFGAEALTTELAFRGIMKAYDFYKVKQAQKALKQPVNVESLTVMTGKNTYSSFAYSNVADDFTVFGAQQGKFTIKPVKSMVLELDDVPLLSFSGKQVKGYQLLNSKGGINVGLFKGSKLPENMVQEYFFLGSQKGVLYKADDVINALGKGKVLKVKSRMAGGDWSYHTLTKPEDAFNLIKEKGMNALINDVDDYYYMGQSFKAGGTTYLEPYVPITPLTKQIDFAIKVGGKSKTFSFADDVVIKTSGLTGKVKGVDFYADMVKGQPSKQAQKALKQLQKQEKLKQFFGQDVANAVADVAKETRAGMIASKTTADLARAESLGRALEGGVIIVEGEDALSDVFSSPVLKSFESPKVSSQRVKGLPAPLTPELNIPDFKSVEAVGSKGKPQVSTGFKLTPDRKPKRSPEIKQGSNVFNDIGEDIGEIVQPKPKPKPKPREDVEVKSSVRSKARARSDTRTFSDVMSGFANFFGDYGQPNTPKTPKLTLPFPDLKFGFGRGFKQVKKASKPKAGYSPSLTALIEGVKGQRPKKVGGKFLGLEVRPAPQPKRRPKVKRKPKVKKKKRVVRRAPRLPKFRFPVLKF